MGLPKTPPAFYAAGGAHAVIRLDMRNAPATTDEPEHSCFKMGRRIATAARMESLLQTDSRRTGANAGACEDTRRRSIIAVVGDAELPHAANPLAYSVGFVIATGLLHLCGIAFGLLAARPLGAAAVRVAGALIAAGGVYFLAA